MKRFIITTAQVALLTLAMVLAPLQVAAAGYWNATISTPADTQTTRTFNVEYTTLSTVASDTFTVELFQNDAQIASKTTTKQNGDSGAFAVTVPTDGTYNYYTKTTNNGQAESKNSAIKQVKVDATAPGAPTYLGKTRTGNTYTIRFTAPIDGDVKQVLVFSALTTTFTADAGTLVAAQAVTPGQTVEVTYTAADNRERFHAVQAFDNAGNGSATVGDPNVIATPAVAAQGGLGGGGAAGVLAAAAAAPAAGQVAGAQNNAGQVNAGGTNTDTNGDVLGAEKDADQNKTGANDNDNTWAWILAAIVAVLAIAGVARREQVMAAMRSRFGKQ